MMQIGIPKSRELEQLERTEWKRRETLCRTVCVVLTCIGAILLLKSFNAGRMESLLVLMLFCSFNVVALIFYHYSKNLGIFCSYLVLAVSLVALYAFITGGTYRSGLLWAPCYPIIIFSLLRAKRALVVIVVQLLLIIAFYKIPNPLYSADYSDYFQLIGLFTYLLSTTFSFIQTHAAESSAIAVTQLNRELQHIASTDELTNLPNRRDINLRLEFECKRSTRTGKEFSVILCDIDYFKKINDSFGHSIGDQALKEFSRLLEENFRKTDKVGRWGGEEFLIILPDTPLEIAIDLAEKVRKNICRSVLFPNMPNRLVTMSCGVASCRESKEPSELIRQADNYLYQAKNAGRNRTFPELHEDSELLAATH